MVAKRFAGEKKLWSNLIKLLLLNDKLARLARKNAFTT
jgi:hypothetical protein